MVGANQVTVSGLALTGITGTNSSVASDYVLSSNSATVAATITPATLTITATGVNKVYDGTTTATVTLSDNRIAGDVLSDNYTTASFTSKNVGTGSTVNVTGISISGTDASDYTLANTTAVTTANITPKPLTITSITASNKVYDGTSTATIDTSSASLTGLVSGDNVTLSTVGATGTFASKNVGTGETVNVTGLSISGADAGNYTLTGTSAVTSANITPATLTATLTNTGVTKVYNGTTAAPTGFTPTYSVTGLVTGDTGASISNTGASYNSSSQVVGANQVTVSGLAITGITGTNSSVASDYVLSSNLATVSSTITPATLTATLTNTGVTKVYNGTTAAPTGFTPTYSVHRFGDRGYRCEH